MLSKSFCVLQFTDYRKLSYYINFAFAILFPQVYADQQNICTETQLSAITTSELGRLRKDDPCLQPIFIIMIYMLDRVESPFVY
ncbi:hypothetical protein T11_13780 [Trichinella zimbabwensis]|uniref:Uncharacterized protein n=1 Tax=Trichinella zimbabwensis TaxID=268475 RepID=A0A0V1GFY1_9BILA|nr:hypothetical protein T11_13780 [Trichinella zimbabwensis]